MLDVVTIEKWAFRVDRSKVGNSKVKVMTKLGASPTLKRMRHTQYEDNQQNEATTDSAAACCVPARVVLCHQVLWTRLSTLKCVPPCLSS